MKYYIIAGEASGDLHGSNLMKAIYQIDTDAEIRCWGGDLMKAAGGELVKHYKDRAFMGFVEILMNLNAIFKDLALCKEDIKQFEPDAIVFIDNSGFNLRIAKWARQSKFKTHYYISPQVWASRAGRVKAIKRDIDGMYVILPFVKSFYKKFNYEVTFVGHPLIDAIANRKTTDALAFRKTHQLGAKPIISLLPGSRKQEIKKMLKVMLELVDEYPEYQFVIAGAPSQEQTFYNSFITSKRVAFIPNQTYDLLNISTAALVTSGTATLETALFKIPQVVCYKGSAISYHIAKRIITLKFISLVNLVMDRDVVTELIQNNFNKKTLKIALDDILNPENRTQILSDYDTLEKTLGGQGASEKTAGFIYRAAQSEA